VESKIITAFTYWVFSCENKPLNLSSKASSKPDAEPAAAPVKVPIIRHHLIREGVPITLSPSEKTSAIEKVLITAITPPIPPVTDREKIIPRPTAMDGRARDPVNASGCGEGINVR